MRNAEEQPERPAVRAPRPDNIPIVERRNYILDLLARTLDRRVLTGNKYTARRTSRAAKNEPICLAPQTARQQWQAPHFVWSVRNELADKLCADAETCPILEQGGLKIITTLDWDLQQIAEKWVTAAVVLPHRPIQRRLPRRSACPTSRG